MMFDDPRYRKLLRDLKYAEQDSGDAEIQFRLAEEKRARALKRVTEFVNEANGTKGSGVSE